MPPVSRSSLNVTYRGGTAWICTGNPLVCGPHTVSPHPDQGDDRHVVLYTERNEAGYDGELYVVELTLRRRPLSSLRMTTKQPSCSTEEAFAASGD